MRRDGWDSCIVAASGPSLTAEVAERCRGKRVIAVNDAWQLLPFADVLYACDARWWDEKGCGDFAGERWSSHGIDRGHHNDKRKAAEKHGLKLVNGRDGDGFSFEPGVIHYGSNSGFQAVNLALQFGATVVRLVGFNMGLSGGRSHFFGDHPEPLSNPSESNFRSYRQAFERAARLLPDGIRIINCTEGSALKCFPMGEL